MQTVTLSPSQRSFRRDPNGFIHRMRERAELLWCEGYTVQPTDETGLFAVNTPTGIRYLVEFLDKQCTCPFSEKADLPEIQCKHLLGLPILVEKQIEFHHEQSMLQSVAGKEVTMHHRNCRDMLLKAWGETLDEVQCRQYEEEQANDEGPFSSNGGGMYW